MLAKLWKRSTEDLDETSSERVCSLLNLAYVMIVVICKIVEDLFAKNERDFDVNFFAHTFNKYPMLLSIQVIG